MTHIDQFFVQCLYAGPDIDDQHRKGRDSHRKMRRDFIDTEQHYGDKRPHQARNCESQNYQWLEKTFSHQNRSHVYTDSDAKNHRHRGADKDAAQAL